jgi:hypothetical protein
MGARIVGRCHDVTSSNRYITHVAGQALPLCMTRRHAKFVHLLTLREYSSRNPSSRFPQLAYVLGPSTLANKNVRDQHFWQTELTHAL